MRTWTTNDEGFETFLQHLSERGKAVGDEVEPRVRQILKDLRLHGEWALRKWSRHLDGMPSEESELEIPLLQRRRALDKLPEKVRLALEIAAERIREFHARAKPSSWLTIDPCGCLLGQMVRPLQRVGIYVPGGKAAYPSSVLMNALPAKVAGVEEVIMCCPLSWSDPDPTVLAAAELAGVDRIFRIGGAQAVGAMAYGVSPIPRVDKIVGPGNAYVATAKRLVYGEVDIDMIAGPSEILVVADGSAPARWAAVDLLSQAEHDEQASAILITPSEGYASEVAREVERLLAGSPRRQIAEAALRKFGGIVITRDLEEALGIASRIAPEHLELMVERPLELIDRIRNAGAVFLGPWSPEAMGDYLAGPNHVLPTGGTARFSSPLSVDDFLKRTSVIQLSKAGITQLGPHAATLAHTEGLSFHARSVEERLEKTSSHSSPPSPTP